MNIHRLVVWTMIVWLSYSVASAGTVSGTLTPPDGANLTEFTIQIGPVYGSGEKVPVNANGTFSATVSSIDQTALHVRFGGNIIGTTLLYGIAGGTMTVNLTVVPPSSRPSSAFQQAYFVHAERTLPSNMPDLGLHQTLIDESSVGNTTPFRLTRFPEQDVTNYLMKAEQIYRFASAVPMDEQRSIDIAYCVSALSLLPVSFDRDTKWVARFMKDLPKLLPPDDPAWALCAYASWVLDEYAKNDKRLATYRDQVFAQHPILYNRLLMMMVSAVEATVNDDEDRSEQLIEQMEDIAPDNPMIVMAEKLVEDFQ